VACALLSAFIEEDEAEGQSAVLLSVRGGAEPQVAATEPGRADRQELRELRELGALIREHLPELLRRQGRAAPGRGVEPHEPDEVG
jgi:hypothetical protein